MRPTATQLSITTIGCALGLFLGAPALAGTDTVTSSGRLVALSSDVPPGATAEVHAVSDTEGDTTVTLTVHGLEARRQYGAHVHLRSCEEGPGPDYQRVPNPKPRKAPHDRAYQNPVNEIWLDVETDRTGSGSATAEVPWQFPPGDPVRSVIIHAERTHVGPDGPPGSAGPRLACLTVAF